MENSAENAALIAASLEHVAERVNDLTPLVYARYFLRHPEARELFGSDDDSSLKGQMLSKLLLQIMDYAEGRTYPDIIVSWAMDHHAYGVKLTMFPAMFDSLEEVLREVAGTAWTEATHRAWRAQFDGLLTLIASAYEQLAAGTA